MQIRIALCDDDMAYHKITKTLLADYKKKTAMSSLFVLSCFPSGKELLNHIDEYGTFDLYILDVIMPDMNGIQLGSALRKRNDEGIIIYLTSSPDFALESYSTDALYYLLKPIDFIQFSLCMDRAVKRMEHSQTETISIKTPGSSCIVPIHSILYAERVNRRIRYYLSDGTAIDSVTFSGTFQNAAAPLIACHGFLVVGSSFVVNLSHVTEVTKSDMVLTEKHFVPVPRRAYEAVKSAWTDYWLDKGDTHVI